MTTVEESTFELTDEQVEAFLADGFVIIPEIIDPDLARRALDRFDPMFAGQFETGLYPDGWNWNPKRDDPSLTRQICNGWRADDTIAAQVLSERTGRIAAQLMGYGGARILQDNCLWKPPGARSLGMHQDGSFADYLVPPEMITCWVALDDTQAGGGTVEHVKGSHLWP